MTITATDVGNAAPSEPAATSVQRPCYLVDLTGVTPSSTVAIDLGPAPMINGNEFATSTTYEASFAVGQVHQLGLSGIDAHPFHLHVNHFQLAAAITDTQGAYFQQGDWHDVIFMVASFFVLTGCFLFVALLWFLLMPQSVSNPRP